MTGQELLDRMELLNQELQLQAGEADVTRGLVALNVAQDYFETLAAQKKNFLWGTETGTIATVNATETTALTSILRLDKLQLLDSAGKVRWALKKRQRTGGHRADSSWLADYPAGSTGAPRAYWSTGELVYWDPLPDGAYTVRWTGLQSAANITAAGTFSYPDAAALPIAAFAVQVMKMGVDDDPSTIASLAVSLFTSVLTTLDFTNRDGARGLEYTTVHTE